MAIGDGTADATADRMKIDLVTPCLVGCLAIAVACGANNQGSQPAHGAPDALTGPEQTTSSSSSSSSSGSPSTSPEASLLTALQKQKAEALTSIWENGTTVLQYGYCENIDDGRGYTSGRAGFCTGTGDAVDVVRCLDGKVGKNALSKYLAPLDALTAAQQASGEDQADTSKLDAVGKYCTDWSAVFKAPATSAAFRECQDGVVTKLYFEPALDRARRWGVVSPLTVAELYDAEINHGEEGVDKLIADANSDTGNGAQKTATAPLSRQAESAWLAAFLTRRVKTLQADATWRDAVDRVATYEQMRRAGDFDLAGPIRTNAKAKTLFPSVAGLSDSGYPDCTISTAGAVSGDADCTSATPKK